MASLIWSWCCIWFGLMKPYQTTSCCCFEAYFQPSRQTQINEIILKKHHSKHHWEHHYNTWLVVWIFPYIGNNNPNWLIFQKGWNHQPDTINPYENLLFHTMKIPIPPAFCTDRPSRPSPSYRRLAPAQLRCGLGHVPRGRALQAGSGQGPGRRGTLPISLRPKGEIFQGICPKNMFCF